MTSKLLTLVAPNDEKYVEEQMSKYRNALRLLVQATGGGNEQGTAQNELDILESLETAKQVIESRCATTPYEWKNDHKQEYKALFNSIESETKETIHQTYSSTVRAGIGFVVSKTQQLFIETMFNILRKVGPEDAYEAAEIIINDARETIVNINRQFHQDDAIVAHQMILQLSRERAASKKKPLSKAARLRLIAKVVEHMKTFDEPVTQ